MCAVFGHLGFISGFVEVIGFGVFKLFCPGLKIESLFHFSITCLVMFQRGLGFICILWF